ncbi:hypothetical protein QJQ45_015191 [Haematococcus lacustris]|nr:hypothetical protein QJQ45_015191 [Haematococcus lacustris]
MLGGANRGHHHSNTTTYPLQPDPCDKAIVYSLVLLGLAALSNSRLYPSSGYSMPLAGSFSWPGHQHSSSGCHMLSPMRCIFNATLQSLSSHLPGCGSYTPVQQEEGAMASSPFASTRFTGRPCGPSSLKATQPVLPQRLSRPHDRSRLIVRVERQSSGGNAASPKAVEESSVAALTRGFARAKSAALDVDASAPFFEPLLRNLVLGLGAGVLAEILHVLYTYWAAVQAAGTIAVLPTVMPSAADALSPLWFLDHSIALSVWAVLYGLEAFTVDRILAQAIDANKAARTIRKTMTLPKRMLPLSLNTLKRSLYFLLNGRALTAEAVGAALPAQAAQTVNKFSTGTGTAAAGIEALTQDVSVMPAPPARPAAPSIPAKPRTRRNKLSGSGLQPVRAPQPGQEQAHPAAASVEGKRERELRERKAYLKNFWYAAALSSKLGDDKPLEVKILGRTVVLFRDKDGVLQDAPSSSKGQLPKRSMVRTYPVEERGGFIWLFFGSSSMPAEERPPIPVIPELESSQWQAVYGEMEFEAPHWNVYDNALDFAHIHYVHSGSFGNPDKPEILDMDLKRDTFGISGSFKIHNKPVSPLWQWTKVPFVPVQVQALLPMTSAVRITLGFGVQMITYVNTVPIDEHRSINRFCLIRNFATSPVMDSFVEQEMLKILGEDKVMVESLKPEDTPFEVSLEADLPQIMFRRLRQEWVDMGYAVSPASTTGHAGSLSP